MKLNQIEIITLFIGVMIAFFLSYLLFRRLYSINKSGTQKIKQNKKLAKELYFYYACNHFFMMKEGETELYNSLGGGNEEDERAWRDEYIKDALSRVNTEDDLPLWSLMNSGAWEAIPELVNLDDYGDGYMKYWFAFTLQELSFRFFCSEEYKRLALQKAYSLYSELQNNSIIISDEHRKRINPSTLVHFKVESAEEYIKVRTDSNLGEVTWHKYLDPDDLEDFNSRLFTKL